MTTRTLSRRSSLRTGLVVDMRAQGRTATRPRCEPDATGSPTTLHVFTGDANAGDVDVALSISTAEEGLIGGFATSGADIVDAMRERHGESAPTLVWDLSTYPPGTVFTIDSSYQGPSGAVKDEETIRTERPPRWPTRIARGSTRGAMFTVTTPEVVAFRGVRPLR